MTDGFTLKKIQSHLPYKEKWNLPIENNVLLKEISKQPYRYLGKGSQCFVFLSEDKKYVLKFFKHYRWNVSSWLIHTPLPPRLDKYRKYKIRRKRESLEDTFNSHIISYRDFQNETGILCAHLNKTKDFASPVLLIDRIGRRFKINPNDYEFVVQQYAETTEEKLLRLRSENRHEEAMASIKELFHLIILRRKRGYNDKDPHLIRNFGFIGDKAIEIDLGGFFIDSNKDLYYFYGHEMNKIYNKIIPWLKKNYPELEEFTKNEIRVIIQRKELYNEKEMQ